jgi:hypothetical protein
VSVNSIRVETHVFLSIEEACERVCEGVVVSGIAGEKESC